MTHDPKLADYLHDPARADHLESFEQHLVKSAALSRALWLLLLSSEGRAGRDPRNSVALSELASAVADHASAAELLFSQGA